MSLPDKPSNFRASFQFKLFSIFTLLTFFITCLISVLYILTEIRETQRFASEQLQLRTQQLADSIRLPLYAENRNLLHQLAEQAAKAPSIRAVIISSPNGWVLTEIHSTSARDSDGVISQTAEVHSNPLVDSVEAALSGHRQASSELLGTVRMERSTADLSSSVHKLVVLSASMAVGFWLAVSLISFPVFRRVTRSFNALVQGIENIQNGDLDYRINIESDDEPARAAAAVNNMVVALQQRKLEKERLQEERLNLERQMLHAQKLESLGVMAGGIAHDFNNLLQSILGNIELATKDPDAVQENSEHITNAINSAKIASHLTGLMLTYAGKGCITKRDLNLNDLIRINVEILKGSASTSAAMELDLHQELPQVLGDEAHVQQLVMNLIINAVESIEDQPGLVKLTTGIEECDRACLAKSLLEEKPEPGRYVFFEVIDNGCGMNSETLKRLFDPFFTTKFSGRGLGMSAVMGIMRSHGGALFVKSKPGKGSTFRALFPIQDSLAAGSGESAAARQAKPELPAKALSGLALVVDDERPVLNVCAKMVRLCGFTVVTASNGIDSVARFREHADEIVVVLMDLTMPVMDGISAMNEIFSIRPDARVILSSGFNKEDLSERITGKAPSGFIRKPYSMNVLEAELQRVMSEG